MLKAYSCTDTTKLVEAELAEGSWVRVEEPNEEEIAKLTDQFGIDRGALDDALDPFEAPRFERDEGDVYIYLRYPYTQQPYGTAPLLIALKDKHIFTIARGTPAFLERFIEKGICPIGQEAALLIRFISEVTIRYNQSVTKIHRIVNRRARALTEMDEDDFVALANYERILNSYLDALIPQASVLSTLVAGKIIAITEDERELAENALLSTNQHIEISKTILDTVRSIRESYSTIANMRLNQVMRVLTALTVIVAVPNIITGFYGMNVPLVGQNHPLASTLIALSIGIVLGCIVTLFWKLRWFKD